jgi:hypothetical protein
MQDLVAKYGGTPGLRKVLEDFALRISRERGLMHYLFSVTPSQLVTDQLQLVHYIMRKPDLDYRSTPKQTAINAVQIRPHVFEDVIKVLLLTLKDAKVHMNDAPRMAAHIIEVIEETRSKAADTKKSVYKTADITTEVLLRFFRAQGITSSYDAVTGEILSRPEHGLAYPLITTIQSSQKTIQLTARAQAIDVNRMAEVLALVPVAAQNVSPISFRAYRDAEGIPTLEGRYEVPTQYGVPQRLLQRVTNHFTWRFEEALKVDVKDVLIKLNRD